MITGSGGLTLQTSGHSFCPGSCRSHIIKGLCSQTDVAIELGGEDAKIIYFTGGIDQRMNGICAGEGPALLLTNGLTCFRQTHPD